MRVAIRGPVRTGHYCSRKASLGDSEVTVVVGSRD